MGYYKFNRDVYIVNGAQKHCIYDLNRGLLYNINQGVLDLINTLISENDFDLNPTLEANERLVIDELLNEKLLIPCLSREPTSDILSLGKRSLPQFAWVEVTRTCNLSCTFCYEESSPNCSERMSLEDFFYVCNELKDAGVKKIQFIGGEPMVLKNDLKLMIEHCYRDFEFIEVYTNGTLINNDWAKFFKKHDIAVALSVHSYIAEEHDQLTTVKGSHRKALRGLEFLKENQVQYRLGTVKSTSCNIGEKPENSTYTLKPKEPKVVGRADLSQYDFEMFKRKAITKRSKTYPIDKNMIVTALSGHQCFMKDLYISSQLEVYPCVMERRVSYGNLKDKKLIELLNEKNSEQFRYLSKDHIEGCKDCEFRYACFDCRPDSNGRGVYQKPWYCTYSPREGKWYDVSDVFKNLTEKKEVVSLFGNIPIQIVST